MQCCVFRLAGGAVVYAPDRSYFEVAAEYNRSTTSRRRREFLSLYLGRVRLVPARQGRFRARARALRELQRYVWRRRRRWPVCSVLGAQQSLRGVLRARPRWSQRLARAWCLLIGL